MENSKSEELISGLVTAFIDQSGNSNLAITVQRLFMMITNKERKFSFLWNKS